ncbi:helix-turn-helix domain-containing protein [Spiroplasma endosymbiont of Anurida maritima]|uniref:helix-turn-helix domain-containing protein n=1 Tax=Spiroplasma endosymbiont of Anurida maritima TaxID=2967972 RepID=UPI0036D41E50
MIFINKIIKQLRINRGLSQKELADLVGMQQSTICRIESDCSSTSWSKIKKILIFLSADFSEEFRKVTKEEKNRLYTFISLIVNNPKLKKQAIENPELLAAKVIKNLM